MGAYTRLVPRLRGHTESVFGEYSALATQLGAINLGQGFPDVDGPDELKEIAIAAIRDGSGNQYPPRHGLPDLLAAVCEHQERFYGLTYDPATEAVIGTGASELITATILALVSAGDEVIVCEPWFDVYGAAIAMADAVEVAVPLAPDANAGFRLDLAAIAAAVTARTTMIVINTPHNPTGSVFDSDGLAGLADLAIRHDLIVLSDEVYEHIITDPGVHHVPLATIDGMRERTVTLGSGGKTFSFTGWKVGWASGPADLIAAVRVVRQHLSYVSGGPFQAAIAAGLRLPDSYFDGLGRTFAAARELLRTGLTECGLTVLPGAGSYFLLTDVTGLGWADGEAFADHAMRVGGVVTIPVARLSRGHTGTEYVRWTFSKRPAVLTEALHRLGQVDLHAP